MKKLILKTAMITFGVTIIAAISLFGIVSFCAPATMMKLTASMGLDGISADYAYQAYSRTEDISYLARAFEISSDLKSDKTASERFDELIADEGFESYCTEQDKAAESYVPSISYRNYIYGNGVCVKYRLAKSNEEKEAIYSDLAKKETAADFPAGNPAMALSLEAANAKDREFCAFLLAELKAGSFEKNESYNRLITILEEAAHE